MSSPAMPKAPTSLAIPTSGGELKPADALAAMPMRGGALLSPLPLSGGRRKSRRISKKAMKMLKKMTPKQLKKMFKGGEDAEAAMETSPSEMDGARRRSRRGARRSRKSRRGMFY